jgi:hypothetical protein
MINLQLIASGTLANAGRLERVINKTKQNKTKGMGEWGNKMGAWGNKIPFAKDMGHMHCQC